MKLFEKVLTQTDIEKRLAVPTASLPQLGFGNGHANHYVDLVVKDSTERVWSFRCSTRLTGNHPKPYLSSGWLEFVQTKGLAINDVLHLYKEEDEASGAQFRIKVQRNISLFGQPIWADL
ncbi:hypothetical protein CCACVL1_16267 [Corchorus capsularis]|uniref:TF-B3 domain-containing protein n=1 Tax=Corchorus capsularis TaxID=210143 RepID=A0A1R3HY26_COCAP|nr:hypothetical protein CCACVL1_16267 [Corchorus capsularis]